MAAINKPLDITCDIQYNHVASCLMVYSSERSHSKLYWSQCKYHCRHTAFDIILHIPLLYAGFSWLIMLWISESDGFLSSSRNTLQLANKNDRLFWITITPSHHIAFAATGYVKLAIHWAIPLAFIYPLFWLARPVKLNNIRLKKLEKFVPMFWIFATAISVSYLVWQDYSLDENYYTNDEGIAKEIARDARRNGIENLAWVSGGWPEVAIIPFLQTPRLLRFQQCQTCYLMA